MFLSIFYAPFFTKTFYTMTYDIEDCFFLSPYFRSMSVPVKQLESDKSSGKDKNRGSPVETSVFYDEREDSTAG